MAAKFIISFVVSQLLLFSTIVHATNHTGFLEEAVNHLVDYTATESRKVLSSMNIKRRIADIAQQQFDSKISREYPRHCNDYNSLNPPTKNGIVAIKPDDGKPFFVYCNMKAFGGGWTRISQRSTDTSVNFYRIWKSYKYGFGYLGGDGWLGLEKIHRLTKSQPAELLISIYSSRINYYYYPQYRNFSIGSEATAYTLYISGFTGIPGEDSLSYSNNAKFSTYDQDHDSSSSNCASSYHGGWWYRNCAEGKLTGEAYSSVSTSNNYVKWPGVDSYAIYSARMEIRLPITS